MSSLSTPAVYVQYQKYFFWMYIHILAQLTLFIFQYPSNTYCMFSILFYTANLQICSLWLFALQLYKWTLAAAKNRIQSQSKLTSG